MSFSVNPLKTVRVVDPRVNFGNEREYAVVSGGSQISWKVFTTNSFSNSAFTFSAPPPNPSISIDPKIYITVPISIDFTGTNTNPGLFLLQDGDDALRAYPISSVCQTLSVRINNSAASINLADVISALLRYNTSHKVREYDYSVCPQMMDYYQRYQDASGTVRNSLASFGSNSWETPRGAFPYFPPSMTNTTISAHIDSCVTEPLFLSPFLFGKGSELRNGFIGVQSMDFQFTFGSLARIWSHNPGNGSTLTNITVNFGSPALLFNYITPKLLEPIPRSITYSYMVVDRFPTDDNISHAPNSTFTMSSNNVQLNTIPRRIYIFARQRNSDRTATTTDTFASLLNISINYNNYSGLLSSASQQQLYNISKKNGCNLSFPEWCGNAITAGLSNTSAGIPGRFSNTTSFAPSGLVGSILCLDLGIDIGLDDLHAPGEILNSQLQITATFANINQTDAMYFTFYIVTVSEGTWTVENLNSIPQIGVLSKEDILNAKSSPMIDYSATDSIYGGDFIGKVKEIGRNVLAGIKTAWPYIKTAAEVAGVVAPLIGLGEEEENKKGSSLVGGKCNGGVMLGGGKKGGKLMSRSELQRKLM